MNGSSGIEEATYYCNALFKRSAERVQLKSRAHNQAGRSVDDVHETHKISIAIQMHSLSVFTSDNFKTTDTYLFPSGEDVLAKVRTSMAI